MIYCVEDDDNIRELVIYTLETTGLKARGFADGSAFMEALAFDTPELILLDIMLPGDDGLELLKKLKSSQKTKGIPVIMVTAKGTEYDKVIGLDSGADDYIAKPFGIMEFLARVRALLRRGEPREMITVRGVTLYPAARRVESSGQDVQLTAKEFNLLEYLMRRAGTVIRREELLEAVWEYSGGEETRTVDVHIRSLRLKLGEEGGAVIRTVRGVGYMAEEA